MFIGAYFLCLVNSLQFQPQFGRQDYIDIYVHGALMTHNGRHIDA